MQQILTKAQAEAVYFTVLSVRDIQGSVEISLPHARIFEDNGAICIEDVEAVRRDPCMAENEVHADLTAFGAAYGVLVSIRQLRPLAKGCDGKACHWAPDPQPDNPHQSKCRHCDDLCPF